MKCTFCNDKTTFLLIILAILLILPLSSAVSTTTTITKNGNAFALASGNYATKTHCINEVCSWVADPQAIVGVYDGNPANWQGYLEYDFDLSQFKNIQSVNLVVEWPQYVGKGLHSPASTGSGSISVGNINSVLKTYSLNAARCYPANDYFANACTAWSFTNSIPLTSVGNITKVFLKTNAKTAWDIGKVSLSVTADVKCSSSANCGTSGLTGSLFCSGKDVSQNFVAFTCNLPGTVSSSCSNKTIINTIQSCVDYCLTGACKTYVCHNNAECDDKNASTVDACVNPSTLQANCSHTPIKCSTNAQCGTDSFVGAGSCSGNLVVQNYLTFTCKNPGTTSSACSNATSSKTVQTCADYCLTGTCKTYVCHNNAECNDNNASTEDVCVNPNTQQATCTHAAIRCSSSANCGTSGLTGSLFCSGKDVSQNFVAFTCNLPGTAKSTCSNATIVNTIQSCADYCLLGTCKTYTCHNNAECDDKNASTTDVCVNPNTQQSSCTHTPIPVSVKCSTNAQCGTNGAVGSLFCSGNNVAQNYISFTCNSPGTAGSSCSNATSTSTIQPCVDYCLTGACKTYVCHNNAECDDKNASTTDVCVNPNTQQATCTHTGVPVQTGVTIVNGKINVNGQVFLVKGVDYAPWVQGTGPDPYAHKPFPGENDDITALLTDGNTGVKYGKDYNGDGKIQTWEMIRFDVETMKSTGANTIRLYAAGSWHDKNLNGVIDTSTNPNVNEIVQGDLPDWAIDRILQYANDNGMKVIVGYWVQEEDFKAGMVANADDLKVAKQAFGRIVSKYKSNPAILGWGIGNEVWGQWNYAWFSWGMDINSYMNQLNDYVRTLDNHPIIYAKYNGENVYFTNTNFDIISINAFTNAAPLIPSQCGTIPSGKACMYGEFGHNIDQAAGQWNEAKQYAGGSFLEYNNVWWKGGDSAFGIVTAQRNIVASRFNALKALYSA